MNMLTTGTAESAESLLGNIKCEVQIGGTKFHYQFINHSMYYYNKFSHQVILIIYLQNEMLLCMFYICGFGLKQDKYLAAFAYFLEMFTQGTVIDYIPLTILLIPILKSVMIRVSTGFNLQTAPLKVCGRSGITVEEKPLLPPLPGRKEVFNRLCH